MSEDFLLARNEDSWVEGRRLEVGVQLEKKIISPFLWCLKVLFCCSTQSLAMRQRGGVQLEWTILGRKAEHDRLLPVFIIYSSFWSGKRQLPVR